MFRLSYGLSLAALIALAAVQGVAQASVSDAADVDVDEALACGVVAPAPSRDREESTPEAAAIEAEGSEFEADEEEEQPPGSSLLGLPAPRPLATFSEARRGVGPADVRVSPRVSSGGPRAPPLH